MINQSRIGKKMKGRRSKDEIRSQHGPMKINVDGVQGQDHPVALASFKRMISFSMHSMKIHLQINLNT